MDGKLLWHRTGYTYIEHVVSSTVADTYSSDTNEPPEVSSSDGSRFGSCGPGIRSRPCVISGVPGCVEAVADRMGQRCCTGRPLVRPAPSPATVTPLEPTHTIMRRKYNVQRGENTTRFDCCSKFFHVLMPVFSLQLLIVSPWYGLRPPSLHPLPHNCHWIRRNCLTWWRNVGVQKEKS